MSLAYACAGCGSETSGLPASLPNGTVFGDVVVSTVMTASPGVLQIQGNLLIASSSLVVPSTSTIVVNGSCSFNTGVTMSLFPGGLLNCSSVNLNNLGVSVVLPVAPVRATTVLVSVFGSMSGSVSFANVVFLNTKSCESDASASAVVTGSSLSILLTPVNSCSLSTGAIIGISVGAVCGAVVLILFVIVLSHWLVARRDVAENAAIDLRERRMMRDEVNKK